MLWLIFAFSAEKALPPINNNKTNTKLIFNILVLIFICFNSYGRVLPKDVEWNDDETGYYTIKNNNIAFL